VRRLVAPERLNLFLGVWGAYMPFGAATALLIGPLWVDMLGWRTWWWTLGASALAMAVWVALAIPAEQVASKAEATGRSSAAAKVPFAWTARLRRTLGTRGTWLVAMCFAAYSSQWLAVIGFLPTIYLQAGVAGLATGALTSLAAAANIVATCRSPACCSGAFVRPGCSRSGSLRWRCVRPQLSPQRARTACRLRCASWPS
jgi:cyanate permease